LVEVGDYNWCYVSNKEAENEGASGNPQPPNGESSPGFLAAELRKVADKLRQLADELHAREQAHQEMLANYPHFRKLVYSWLREQFERELPPLPYGKDLRTIAQEEGARPLEALLAELELPDPHVR
jgi:hypothetical protein